MSAIEDVAPAGGRVRVKDLQELGSWPYSAELEGVDLSLEDRARVSALPWRGQFSPMTVERLLAVLAPPEGHILDPFVGSGTTLLEAARRGSCATGFDVNPAAIALARCACLASLDREERRARLDDAIRIGLHAQATEALAGTSEIDEAHAVALLAHVERSPDGARRRLEALLEGLPTKRVNVSAELGDARATGLAAGCVDFLLTSPPYINVFNYHQYGRPLSDAFGWPVLMAARSEIGSNRQNRGNRFRTVIQYSIDMALAVAEMSRLLRSGGAAVLVVGRESRVRGLAFYNGELLARLARAAGAFQSFERAERVFVSRFGERIYEDVLVLSGSRSLSTTANEMEELGRSEGVRALQECVPGPSTEEEVDSAIREAAKIGSSPLAGLA